MESPFQDVQAERVDRFFDRLSTLHCLKYLVIGNLLFKFFQVIITLIVLVINRNTTCKAPLKLFLTVYTVIVLTQGFLFYYRCRRYLYPDRAFDLPENSELGLFNNFVDAFNLFWYLTGFHWVHECKSCKITTPSLYYTSLVWIYCGVFFFISPLVAIILLIVLITYIRPKLPVFEYTRDSNIPQGDANCTICLNEYNEGEKIKSLPCKHHFHVNCIDEWFNIDDICPMCRKPINIIFNLMDEHEVV